MFSLELTKQYPETTSFITNAILKNKLANSYVFIGRNINDILLITTEIAKILNCEQNKDTLTISNPCGKCLNCRWLDKYEHPQALICIAPDETAKKEQIKIETIRELLTILKTSSAYFRIIFFKNSNLVTLPSECGNLLLKTVEEALPNTMFIFANTTKNDILPTLLSRSQIIYASKKYDSFLEMLKNNRNICLPNTELINYNSKDIYIKLESARKAISYINEYNINPEDYFYSQAVSHYEQCKHANSKHYCKLIENLQNAFLKYKSFMQPKILIQDLFLTI